MAEARQGAESRTPAVEMDAVSMNCRRVEWNKRPSFRKAAASRLLLWARLARRAAETCEPWASPSNSAYRRASSTKAGLCSARHHGLTSV